LHIALVDFIQFVSDAVKLTHPYTPTKSYSILLCEQTMFIQFAVSAIESMKRFECIANQVQRHLNEIGNDLINSRLCSL